MKKLLTISGLISTMLLGQHALAQDTARNYNEPTRGFFIEHAMVAGQGKVSAELHSGSDDVDAGGGIRLGLPNSELIINSGISAYDENEVKLKWGLGDLLKQSSQSETEFNLAAILAVSHVDNEDANGNKGVDQTNAKLGAAFTVAVDAATFTLAPTIVHVDGNIKEDTFVTTDIGAYVGIIDTQSGLFSMGVEALFTTEDNVDHSYAVGGRWAYNERVNLDFVPFVFSKGDRIGFPGLVRLNVGF